MAEHLIPSAVLTALAGISNGDRAAKYETETLDFKQEAPTTGETTRVLVDAAICFANLRGGTIVLGIADDIAGPDAFLGATATSELVRRRIFELTKPQLTVSAFEYEYRGRCLLIIGVQEGMEMVSDTKGRASRRSGDACLPLTISQAATLNDDRRRFDWSAEPSTLPVTAIVPEALANVRERLRRFDDERRRLAEASDSDLLCDLGLLREGRLLRAAEVLLCVRPSMVPLVYLKRNSPGGEAQFDYRESIPGLLAYNEALRSITEHASSTTVILPDGQQLPLYDFPLVAVREALSNALIHRDYRQPDPILVDHSPAVLSVTSPGPLVTGVSTSNILHVPSKPRNGLLAEIARKLGLAETLSRGVDRMYREMIKLGKRPPEIVDLAPFSVRVDLTGGAPNQTVARYVSTLPESTQDDVDAMLVLFSLLQRQTITAQGLAPVLQRGLAATETILEQLHDPSIDLVAPVDRSGTTRWQLSARATAELRTALSYKTVDSDELDRKVIEFVRKNETIDNRTIQIFFDLDVQGAAYRLRSLVKADVLRKLGDQKRGPGIKYGPGPRFPHR